MHIAKLTSTHQVNRFDCGVAPLNIFLQRYALQNQKKDGVQTWVGLSDQDIIGYYSLVVGSISHQESPEHLTRGLPRHPVPVMVVLARLTVDIKYQNQRVGQGLLADALRRTMQAADIAGIRAVLVHAKNENAAQFYSHFGFEPFPESSMTLYRLVKDIRAMLP